MVVPPFYDVPSVEELHQLLVELHSVSKLPIMYYNIPSASGLKLSPIQGGLVQSLWSMAI